MGTLLSFAERLRLQATADALRPPPPIDYLAWAEANITFAEGESPRPGPYNREAFGYFDEILRALSPDDPCRIVTLAKSAQIGGTIIASIFTGGSLTLAPGNFMYVHPTEENARRWSKMKFAPMVRSTPALGAIFSQKSRDGADSVLYKERTDGRGALQISGANSAASLSQVTMPRQVQDDLSKWETNIAGDPEGQADSRSRAIEFAKIFKVSTPLVMPGCRITTNFEAGSQEYPYVPCPHCGHMQILTWENMLAHLDEKRPEAAHFVCTDAECGGVIEEYHRPWMRARLDWRAHNPAAKREHRSFWIWSAYSDLQSFERIAREWLKARGNPAAEKTFLNDGAGLAYRAQGEAPPWETLRDRAAVSHYAKGEVPAGCLVLFLGLDCQQDRVEWQVVGFGRRGRRFVVDYNVVRGHISEAGTRTVLDGMLRQTWTNGVGRPIGIEMAAIDGNAWTEDVWGWAKRHPASRVIMVRGRHEDHVPLIAPVKRERNAAGVVLKYSKRFYNFGTSILKMALYRNLAKTDPLADGFVALPRGLDDEYFRQLTAERRVPKVNKQGYTEYVWEKDRTQANEALDTMLQAEAAAIKFNVRSMPDSLWDRYEAERETPPPSAQLDFEDLPLGAALAPAPVPASTTPVSKAAAPTGAPKITSIAALAAMNRR